MTNPELALQEFYRILKPGGKVQIMVYNRNSLWFHLKTAYQTQILENKFDAAENSRQLALAELQAYEKVVYFTAALTIILGVALYRCKCDKLSGKKPRKVKRVNKNRKF
jgi:SAM-dependent methyltransferase